MIRELKNAVEAFLGMAPKDIIPYIEGEPYISKVPVEPGLTNPITTISRACILSGFV